MTQGKETLTNFHDRPTGNLPMSEWSKQLPGESGLWWWWNEDEDSNAIVVDIAFSGTDGTYFAMQGQHGWSRFQPVSEMQGWWMRLHEPKFPSL